MSTGVLGLLGLGRRSGRVIVGMDAALREARRGQAAILWLADDAGASTERQVRRAAEQYGTPLVVWGQKLQIGQGLGLNSTAVMAIVDARLAQVLLQRLDTQKQTGGESSERNQ